MAELIGCRSCDSPNCKGCNVYTLDEALSKNHFKLLMDERHSVHINADVVPVVRCGECKHWKRIKNDCILASCELDALVRSEDFFCADGERDRGTGCTQIKDGDGNGM